MSFFNKDSSHYLIRLYKEYLSIYKTDLIISSFLMSLVALCNGLMVIIVKPTIDKLFITFDSKYFVLIPVSIIIITLSKGIAEYFQNYLLKNIGQRLVSNMQLKMYENFINSNLEIIQEYSSGRIMSKFTNDIILMRGSLLKCLEGLSKHLISIICFIGIMFYTEPYISLFLFLLFPFAIYPIHLLGKKIEISVIAAQKELEHFTSNIQESLDSSIEVKSYLGEECEINRMHKIIETIFIHYQNSIKFDSLSSPIIETLGGIFLAFIIVYGCLMISDSSSSPGSIYSFIAAFSAAYRPFKSITALNIYFREGVGASKRIFTLLDISKTHNNNSNQISIINEIDNIEIKNVSLIKDEKVIINNISLKIKGPINIAIIGESGSGKTSLANVICGFWTPSSGEILINKNNINLYSNNSLRKNIAYITQNTKLFNIKIKDNISYPNISDNLDKIKETSKLAFADEFISNLKNEYDYIVKDNGSKFSAGQLQKISIARILYKNSSLMVFDEATNSIDYHTEQKIKANILNNGKKINIFITHKIDSLEDFDQIIMMKNGSITEIGTHDQLIKNKEEYFYLFKKNSSLKAENIKN